MTKTPTPLEPGAPAREPAQPQNDSGDATHARSPEAGLTVAVAAALTRGGPLRDVLQLCTEAMVKHLDVAFARIWTLNEAEQVLELQASAGMYTHLDGPHGRVPVGALKIGKIASERTPHLTNDVPHDPRVSDQDWARREGMVAFSGYPLIIEDRVVGVMAMFSRHGLGDAVLEALGAVADGVALAIERDRTEAERDRALAEALQARHHAEEQATELEMQAEELQSQATQLEEAQAELEATNDALRLTNDQLGESVQRMRFVMDSMPQKVWTADPDGDVNFFNQRWLQYTGASLEDLRGWGWKRVIHPDDWEENARLWQHSIRTGDDFEMEHRFLRADGEYRWHLSRGAAQSGADGSLLMWVGTNTDIHEQKQTEDALRASESRYRLVTRATNDVIWDWNLANDELLWNDALETTFGYALADVPPIIQFWYDHVHAEDRDRIVEGIHEAIDGGRETWSDEYRFLRSDGEYAQVLDRGVVSRDLAGQPTRMIGSMQDMTERKRAEEEREQLLARARTERERLEQIFTAAPAVMAIYSGPDHVVTLVNPTWVKTVGKPDVVGKRFREVFPEMGESGLFELLDGVYETGEPYVQPEVTVPLDRWGSGVLEETSWNLVWLPLPAREGQVERDILVHAVEVTEQVRARRAIEAAREAAEDANLAKAGFLATMSHELRTPLNAMIGYTDLLLMGLPEPIPKRASEQVRRIGLSARHLLQIIEEILTFSRLEAGRETVDPEQVDLRGLAEEVCAILEPLAQTKGLRFTVDRPEHLAEIRTDPRKLRQILINLVGNALKFTEHGEVELAVREEDGWATFRVEDTGIGVAPDQLESIFEPFRQVETGRSQRAHGTGLGLSVSRRLARLMDGDITVTSIQGKGSIFTVRLPNRGV